MALKTIAEEYFSNLNPIASRLFRDLEETKTSYEELWNTIPEKEQQTILSESIIKPEISIKYGSIEADTKSDYAVKVIFDDHCSYRDEHSGPFSFKTRSQRDLSTFHLEQPTCIKESKPKPKGLKIKLPPLKQTQPQIPKPQIPKPKIKEQTPMYHETKPLELLDSILDENHPNSLPKTGLDFLDNW